MKNRQSTEIFRGLFLKKELVMKKKIKLVLASQSPRRKELLQLLGIPFEVIVSDVEEKCSGTDPEQISEKLSEQKAEAVVEQLSEGIVIGADTIVSTDGEILGKPKDRQNAKRMLQLLQGRTHLVTTGVMIKDAGKNKTIAHFHVSTKVKVAALEEWEIEAYLDTSEPYDKAGGYGIQGIFSRHIEQIEGDYFNVVGLPVHMVYEKLKEYFDGTFPD